MTVTLIIFILLIVALAIIVWAMFTARNAGARGNYLPAWGFVALCILVSAILVWVKVGV